MSIRVLIVDDHAVVRLGLKTLLADEKDIEVVGEAGTAEQAFSQTERTLPDVVVLDIQLPGENGIKACQSIVAKFPNTRVVMLTSHANDAFLEESVRAGASGYVLKQVGNEELIRAIRAAYQGEMAFDTKTTSQMVNQFKQMEKAVEEIALSNLSQREIEVMTLVADGESNKEIGRKLNLSEITVRNYVSNILSKLQLRNRIEIATYAMTHHMKDNHK